MEQESIRTGWPHSSNLYRLLCGKLWIPQMSLHPEYKVPPTTRVHVADFRHNHEYAATRALHSLMQLRYRVWGREQIPLDEFRGVVKLGFSWCGGDVLPFTGVKSLVQNLSRLFDQPSSEQIVCLVQERIMDVVGEHRVLAFRDAAHQRYHMEPLWVCNLKPEKHHRHNCDLGDFRLASSSVIPHDAVAGLLFNDDAKAQKMAEQIAMELVDKWMLWFMTESATPPQCARIDFLVAKTGPGKVEVWTCEVGECGASLCSLEPHGRNAAVLNSAIITDDSGRFPLSLPRRMPKNDGSKSS
eukprot:gnl/TRDRNA2_/TRDRNA2_144213_c1_seq1.p1 gnl/TRDRNA2_/TRDRNA2_144213_c1~~gnl/TRDRNA2_/TRDRNA2_144213_c1_seq1.p1  ORF type:complete len:299 (+),score=31.21 gnl/TRDRNA2_/TRDRNA2_144213_c1_seq1:522-1418(+)